MGSKARRHGDSGGMPGGRSDRPGGRSEAKEVEKSCNSPLPADTLFYSDPAREKCRNLREPPEPVGVTRLWFGNSFASTGRGYSRIDGSRNKASRLPRTVGWAANGG